MSRYRSDIIVSLLLIITTLAVYLQIRNYEFVNYDDYDYVTQNRHVQHGWTREGVLWAFTAKLHGHWHPLTWLSHMTDYQLFGRNPGGHHLTSLFLHVANALLLFLILKSTTGALMRSGFVAALFALHPLHVESVAWVADRKDVLSTFFWMLAMWAYVKYSEDRRLNRYLLGLTAFVLGLMAKPMIVTLPFIFLLMDYWPLGRFQRGQRNGSREVPNFRHQWTTLLRLAWEKVPFFIAMGASSIIAMSVRQHENALILSPLEWMSTESRIPNALFSYMTYMRKMLWPVNLAIPYPEANMLTVWQAGTAGLLLFCVSFLVFWRGRRYPYLPVGWLWYLVTLLPVIGLVKGGPRAIADRYTYVPLIGLFVMIAWGVPDVLSRWRYRTILLATSTGIVLSVLAICTWSQARHWRNSMTLCEHALEVTSNNVKAHNNLGNALLSRGRIQEAGAHYSEALRIEPNSAKLHYNLGIVRLQQGRFEEAIVHFLEVLRISPDSAETHSNLGIVLLRRGRLDEAIAHFLEALRIKPKLAEAHSNLGTALLHQGRLDEAIAYLSEALRLNPNLVVTHKDLGTALMRRGRIQEARTHFSEVLRIKPDDAEARQDLDRTLRHMMSASSQSD